MRCEWGMRRDARVARRVNECNRLITSTSGVFRDEETYEEVRGSLAPLLVSMLPPHDSAHAAVDCRYGCTTCVTDAELFAMFESPL